MEFLHDLDVAVVLFFNSFAGKYTAIDRGALYLVQVNLFKGGVVTALLCYAWLATDWRLASPRSVFLRSVIGMAVALVLGVGLQLLLPFRLRPQHDPEVGFVPLVGQKLEALEGWSSFPSDHAVLYFAVVTAIFFVSRRAGLFALIWTLVFTILPRIYVGAHFPSDLVEGAVLGVLAMWAAFRAPLPAALPNFIAWWEDRYPASLYTLAFLFAFQVATVFNDARRAAKYGVKILTGVEL